MKQSVICPFLGRLRDRFCEYGRDIGVIERLEAIARIPGVDGVEIVYPQELQRLEEVKSALDRLGLGVSAVNVNVKSDAEFVCGSMTSPDLGIRARAVEYIHKGKDAAAYLGADRVTCCPLSDGHDYAFHIHFGSAWERMVEVVKAAAGYRPEITLHLEYKPWETRSQNLLNSAAKTVLLCEAAGRDGLGVTVDIGHSTFGGETPAQSLMLAAACGYPYYVHTNDNNGRADWDLVAGSCNLWEYAEFLFYLKELGYEGWIASDVAPVRQDPAEIFALNARVTRRIWEWLDEVDREEIRQRLHRHDYMSVRKLMEPYLFPRLGSSTGVAAR